MPRRITSHALNRVIRSRSAGWALAWCLACGPFVWLTGTAGAAVFVNPAPIAIPPVGTATPYRSQISVSGLTGTTTDVNVTLNSFSHTFPGDVAVVLVPPSGTSILLMMNAGTTPATSGATISFDGSATGSLPVSGSLTTGSYKPTANAGSLPSFTAPGPGTSYCNPGPAAGGTHCTTPAGGDALAQALDGFDPNGTWDLYVVDRFSGDSGQIAGGWTLDIGAGGGPQRTVTVARNGTGTGSVTSAPAGINCGGDCAQAYADGTAVTLTAAPSADSNLASWGGCDSTTAITCTVAINAARNVTATFNLNPPQALTVAKGGTAAAAGTVTSSPAGIACGATCSAMYPGGTPVTLTASAPVGSVFGGFTGCDTMTTSTTCAVDLTAARNVTATFTTVPTHRLTVVETGSGSGNVAGPGIGCRPDCTELYNDGTSVTLVANPTAAGSRFTGWSGCDDVSGNTCTVSMTTEKAVTATFTQRASPAVTAAPAQPLAPDTVAPTATGVRVTNRTFAVAGEATPTTGFAARTKHKRGTTVKYTLSENATVKIAIARRRSGRRNGKRCVTPTAKLRKAARCTRITPKGRLARASARGANAVFFSGRIGSSGLSPGSYQATLTATDAANNVAPPTTIFFRIVKR
jgi:subtilisin-like proprotein convertase family protein